MANNNEDKNVIKQNITQTLEENYMPYAMSVIISRAIPEIDGFKPSHRKLLYTMYKMGLLNGNRKKSADIVGQTMQLNPHGDGAIYETMVRLTRGNEALTHAFIDSKGNFGKQYSRDMAYAASRYTEAKLSDICKEVFENIDKNTVDFVPNYNGSMTEPTLFPVAFPNLLVTPNTGIAVGMASSICSFNLKEVCETTIAYIKDNDCDLLETLKAPDFSTGGMLIYNKNDLQNIYQTGRGSVKVKSKYSFDKKNNCIEITEIPYTTTIEVIIDKVISLVKTGKIREINDIRDETDLNGMKIAIDVKRNTDVELLMLKLFKSTSLSDNFSCNFNFLIEGKPKVMGIKEILYNWVKFRTSCIKRQIKFDLDHKEQRLHLLEGLSKIILDIDKVIKIIRETEEAKNVIPNLMKAFSIDELQAEYIAEIRLRNLNKEYLLGKINETDELKKDIEKFKEILESDKKIKEIIVKQLKEISKKYGIERKTEIIYEEEQVVITNDTFIEDYQLKMFITRENYIKKISIASLRGSERIQIEQLVKENDEVIQEIEGTNKSELLLFSNKFNVYKAKVHEIPDCKASSLGEYLPNHLSMEEGESIIHIQTTINYDGFMLFAFRNGKIAKISMKAYETKVNRKKLMKGYSDKSPLVFIKFVSDESILSDENLVLNANANTNPENENINNIDFVAIRDKDKATLFSHTLLPVNSTRNSGGVQVVTLKKDSNLTKVYSYYDFISDDREYYRTEKIPTTGHFITEKDRVANKIKK